MSVGVEASDGQLEAKAAQVKRGSFWHSKAGTTFTGALFALVGTLLTTIITSKVAQQANASAEHVKQRELELADRKAGHELEKAYFDRATDASTTTDIRARVLRYLERSSLVEPEMNDWARTELALLTAQAKADLEIVTAQAARTDAEIKASGQPDPKTAAPQQAEKARLLKTQRAQLDELEKQALVLKTVVGSTDAGSCKPGSVKAIGLGPDDPGQAEVDAYCSVSSSNRKFPPDQRSPSWKIRHEGRNFACHCEAR